MNELELLRLQSAEWGLALDSADVARLGSYARLLWTYEEANVIGTRALSEIVLDHVLDSLSCFLFERLGVARSMVDIGSGGGLPGVPIKIVAPRPRTTLVESTAKKARFLRRVGQTLMLEGVEVANARAEEVARTEAHRGVHDVATARAVARLSVVAEYCVPLLRVGGCVISMKGKIEDEELREGERAAKELGAKISRIIRVPRLPELGEKERRLIILEKVEATPAEYPRKVGIPAKKPLGVV
jgi:16S rRNA (guanine527-N7)-methyltransferase